jgi:hypothetical protein
MLVKGQAPKVLIAVKARTGCKQSRGQRTLRLRHEGPYGQSLTTQQMEGLHLFPAVARSAPLSPLKNGVSRGGTDNRAIVNCFF